MLARAIQLGVQVFAVLLLGLSAAGADGPIAEGPGSVGDLNRFRMAYHQEVYATLLTIRAHPMTEFERFLVLAADRGQRYVQCLFHDDDTMIFCEASSGYYGPRRRPMRLSPAARRIVGLEGFSTDGSHGNYKIDLPVRDDGTLWDVADRMLETLFRVYGAGLGSPLFMDAPFGCTVSVVPSPAHRLMPDKNQIRSCRREAEPAAAPTH